MMQPPRYQAAHCFLACPTSNTAMDASNAGCIVELSSDSDEEISSDTEISSDSAKDSDSEISLDSDPAVDAEILAPQDGVDVQTC